ncbi:hypothetical protein ACIPMZ_15995 [Scandinavium goeteborgense]|uniref:hypothetical protein n=1 Tax=Scandinavium goeteborgense TaxID=1851514 RepID=UPI003803AA22
MASDYITEQMEEQHRENVNDFIAEKAAILIVTEHYSREAAISNVVNVLHFRDAHSHDYGYFVPDEDGYPAEWLVKEAMLPNMPYNVQQVSQIKAVAQEIRHLVG